MWKAIFQNKLTIYKANLPSFVQKKYEKSLLLDHSPINQNFELNESRPKFHHSLKEHHKISNIPKFRCNIRNIVIFQSLDYKPFSYPEPFLRAVRRGALAKSITGYHKNMVRKQYPVLELATLGTRMITNE
jgi:hypothetical protein